ncbi:MAG: Hsp20/alpha crystallin family protein [Treponema sp.]|nr:Hsp20/alpha crystallin family protein [Treponema sp.]
MKTTHPFLDLGTIFDELFNAANQFCNEFEITDCYPGFSYPPMNIFLTEDKSLNFEFALAGFDEKNISLSFSGDYMIFSAHIEDAETLRPDPAELKDHSPETGNPVNVHYLKRRLKFKDIEKQKYYVPMDKYSHEKVQAVYKNGILKVTIPPRPEKAQSQGISITIITES